MTKLRFGTGLLGALLVGLVVGNAQQGGGAATAVAPVVSPEVAAMQEKLQDWPNLARYREENAALPAPRAGEKRVVFLGDSLTDSWGRREGSFFPGKPYVNRGISGQTTPQMVLRFQQDVVRLKPAAVVILAGTNDLANNTGPISDEAIEDNFRAMVAMAKAAHIRVVLSSILPADRFPWHPGIAPADRIGTLNTWLEAYAAAEKLGYLNYFPALVNTTRGMREELAVDKAVHPNAAGYALMMPLAEAAIAKSLSMKAP